MPEFIEKSFKSIINKGRYIDPWFWCRYTINPYNGCLIACTYCDSRSAKYHMPIDFENQIIVKTNAHILTETQIRKGKGLPRDVVVIGGTTDGYQAAEKKYQLTRGILDLLLKYKFPVHIITKSDLVVRDIDLLEKIGLDTWCNVSITITSMDDKIAGFLEKRAPSPAKRLETITQLKSKGINCGVTMIPLIPYINDSKKQLREMVSSVKSSGADYLVFSGGMTMRDQQATHFLNNLKTDFPHLLKKYEGLYQFEDGSDSYQGNYAPPQSYSNEKQKTLISLCEEFELPYRIKRYIPRDHRAVNYRLAEQLFNDAYDKQIQGSNWKTEYWTAHLLQNLSENVIDIINRGELDYVKGITKAQCNIISDYVSPLND